MTMNQLGDWVRHRRTELGLTQEEAARRGPLSEKTLRSVEAGRLGAIRVSTRRALERALEWDPHSVDAAITSGIRPGLPPSPDISSTAGRPPAGEVPPTSTLGESADKPDGAGVQNGASASAGFAAARAVLGLRQQIERLRGAVEPSVLEIALAGLVQSQREAEIALTQSMQWIVNDDARRREATQLLYELQQPLKPADGGIDADEQTPTDEKQRNDRN